jgi:hypothetical protein
MEGAYAEMTVSKDGKKVATKIVGIKGKACTKIQAHFNGLGTRTHEGQTLEYLQEPVDVQQTVVARH